MMSPAWLQLRRAVRFGDTDAAGVMHFHQLLRWCHEAWEESLECQGTPAQTVFPGCRDRERWPQVALPVVHCGADFLRPVHGGDQLTVLLKPQRLDPSSFEVHHQFLLGEQNVARGWIRHVAISIETRRRCNLPEAIERWLEASQLGQIKEL
jgi:1,4-dihydroxy-2-naphthoyl-CoA hydrolase